MLKEKWKNLKSQIRIYLDLGVRHYKVHRVNSFATYARSRRICSWFTPKEKAFAATECTPYM